VTAVERRLTFPATEDAVRSLRAGDVVWADGEAIGMRDRTHVRIFEERRSPPFDLAGALVLHTAPNVRRLGPGRYEPVSVGTTTSARMARYTEVLARDHGVRAICGKGGLPDQAIDVMRRYGMVYLALVGGTAALETRQMEAIEEVAWEDLMPECLWRFRVRGLGPLTVGIDAHGGSLYRDVRVESERRLEDLLARL
jgi:L(+)-tartrate dehydratase beta subunit